MAQDAEFKKKDFDRIIQNLLQGKPLRKKDLGTSKQTKLKTVLPVPRQPKHEREGEDSKRSG